MRVGNPGLCPLAWLHLLGHFAPHACAFPSSCVHGTLSCSMEECSRIHGGLGPWGTWSLCSRSCGGLGTRTRTRQCLQPTLVPGELSCHGPRQDLDYCFSPECPGKGSRKELGGQLSDQAWLSLPLSSPVSAYPCWVSGFSFLLCSSSRLVWVSNQYLPEILPGALPCMCAAGRVHCRPQNTSEPHLLLHRHFRVHSGAGARDRPCR